MRKSGLSIDDLFTAREQEAIILALVDGRNPEPVSEEEVVRALKWAAETKVSYLALQNVLAGDVLLGLRPGGELVFMTRESKQRSAAAVEG